MSKSTELVLFADDTNLFSSGSNAISLPGEINNDITVTSQWARWRLKSPASRLFTQAFIQAKIKENIKAPRHSTGDRWIPRTKGQNRGKCFDLMTS